MANMLTVQQVEYLAAGREIEVLERVAGIPRELLDGRNHPCPLCGGKDRFRLINPNEGTVLCNQCFHEKNHGYISAVMHFQNCSFLEALRKIAVEFNGGAAADRNASGGKEVKSAPVKTLDDKKYAFKTTFTPIYSADGSPKIMRKSCFAVGRKPWGMDLIWNGYSYTAPETSKKSNVLKHTIYEYTDGNEEPLYMVYRIDFKNGRKIPAFFHWNGKVYESGKPEGMHVVPFNAVRLKESEEVFIVEGEKCAVALQWWIDKKAAAGEPAGAVTCVVGGCSQFLDDYKTWFRGKKVFIYPDNDEPGMKYARTVYETLREVSASLKVYKWAEGTPEKWDIADEIKKLCGGVPGCAGVKNTAPAQSLKGEDKIK